MFARIREQMYSFYHKGARLKRGGRRGCALLFSRQYQSREKYVYMVPL